MAAKDHSDGHELPVLSSQEICDRTSSDRSIIGRALGDLKEILAEHDLQIDDYVFDNRNDSQYGLRGVRVDVVEILAARGAPDDADRLLGEITDSPAKLGLAQANRALFSASTLTELAAVLHDAAERTKQADTDAGDGTPTTAEATTAEPSERGRQQMGGPHGAPAAQRPARVDSRAGTEPDGRRRRRRRAVALGGPVVLAAGAVVVIAIAGGRDKIATPLTPNAPGRLEITGGAARTWSNYQNAGGTPGMSLTKYQRVYVTCRLRGFQAGGTNPWWYRLGQPPWSNRFYASADGFYDNGRSSGPLKGTPKVDPRVPLCP
jgi:hypothetical protein